MQSPCMRFLASLLLLTTLASAGDAIADASDGTDKLIDQLFDCKPEVRAAARVRLLAMDRDILTRVLKRIEDRQVKSGRVLQVYAVRDLVVNKLFWPSVLKRLQTLDATVRQQSKGVLVVLASKEVHGKVATILTDLRRRLSRVVTVTSSVVQLGKGMKVPGGFGKGEFEQWIAKHDVIVRRLPKLTGRDGQRVEITAMRRISFVADFDVELACGGFIADPVVDTVLRGVAIHVRPIVVGNAVDLHLEVRSGGVTQPMKVTKLPMPVGPGVRIQTPESRSVHIRTSRRVESGASAVIDLGDRSIVVITAEAAQLGE